MTIAETKLLEEFIDLKLKRLLIASQMLTTGDLKDIEILRVMIPMEQRLEELRQALAMSY